MCVCLLRSRLAPDSHAVSADAYESVLRSWSVVSAPAAPERRPARVSSPPFSLVVLQEFICLQFKAQTREFREKLKFRLKKMPNRPLGALAHVRFRSEGGIALSVCRPAFSSLSSPSACNPPTSSTTLPPPPPSLLLSGVCS